MKKIIKYQKEEKTVTVVEREEEIELPVFWICSYKYYHASFDGESTIQIGLNGNPYNLFGTHNLKTYQFFDKDYFDEKSTKITAEQFKEALLKVRHYTDDLITKIDAGNPE